jgi:hypothetical protein
MKKQRPDDPPTGKWWKHPLDESKIETVDIDQKIVAYLKNSILPDWDTMNWRVVSAKLEWTGLSAEGLKSKTCLELFNLVAANVGRIISSTGCDATAVSFTQTHKFETIILDPLDVKILTILNEDTSTMGLVDLAVAVECGEKTCGERVNHLIEFGYAVRKSERSGVTITSAGRARIIPPKASTS